MSAICALNVLTMAYPQAPNNLARFFFWDRQSSYDEFNYLQPGQPNRPCVPEQYYHRQRTFNERSPQTRRTFYLSYPTYAPSRPNMYQTTTASYNSYGGYPCDQATTYRPFWLDIANLFGFGLINNNVHDQPTNADLNGVRPVYENNDHSNVVSVLIQGL